MTSEQQALYLNVIPLLALGVIYLAAGVSLVPGLRRDRRELERTLALGFACGGAAAVVFALLILRDREPMGGNGWLGFAAILVAALPALAFFARYRWHARSAWTRLEDDGRRLNEARTLEDAARALIDQATALVHVEFGALVVVEEEGTVGRGILGSERGREHEWVPGIRLDLEHEPSGMTSAYHDAAPLTVYDAPASPLVSQRLVERVGARSLAFVPLIAEQRVLAVLVLASLGRQRAFSGEEVARLLALAAEAAPVVEGLRSTPPAGHRATVARLAAQVRADRDVDEVVRKGVEAVGQLLDADRCFVRLGTSEGQLVLAGEWRRPENEAIGGRSARLAVSNLAVREGRTIAIADIATASELDDPSLGGRQALLELGSRAALAVPLVAYEQVIGVVAAHRNTPGNWKDGEIALVEAAARELGVALHTAELLAENAKQLARERALYRIASLLVEPVSLSATLDALARAAQEAFAAASAAVLTTQGGTLRLAGAHDLPASLREALEEGAGDGNGLTLAVAEQQVLASRSLADDDRFSGRWPSLAGECGFRSVLVVPLESRTDAAGLVLVFFTDDRALRDEDLELADHLGHAGRVALERSELYEAERTSRALAQQLARTGSVLATELDPAAVLDEVVELAPVLLAADACAVRLVDGEELMVAAVAGEGTELTIGERAPASGWLAGEVARTREPVPVEDASVDESLGAADPLVAAGYAAYLGVPLVGPEGALHGVLSVYGRRARAWRPEEVEALLALAANTSAALSNAELYQRVALEKERSAAILENIADGIVALDRHGEVVLWNKAAEEATGVPPAEALGRTIEQILGRSLAGAAEVPIRRGGDEIWLSVTEAVMRDPAGQVAGRIFAFRDISEDRSVEALKSQFVSTVSHELRGPLTSIFGFAETLLRQDVPFGEEERRVFLRYIATESERLTRIVDALLNVARLEAGDLDVTVSETDLRPLVTEVVSTARENGGMNGHRFVLELPAEPLAARADADKVRQVLAQLLENAIKFSPNGGCVTVSARRTSDTVEVHVRDEGAGIPAAERERIFRKFYRADQARGGTGLGLFIAQRLVNAMGGRIWVESAEGEGSRFGFELPAARVKAVESAPR